MPNLLSAAADSRAVTSIEGEPTVGTFFVTPMLTGGHLTMLEIRAQRGVKSQVHSHAHESMIYVVSGALRTVIGTESFVVHQGQACRHPENVAHTVEALDDTIFVEVKSPVPDLVATLS
jgi:quercetin dioxygenase-like cupin family protein